MKKWVWKKERKKYERYKRKGKEINFKKIKLCYEERKKEWKKYERYKRKGKEIRF